MPLKQPYQDFALILSWPEATIRGDESWMMFFKKIGLVKNLNFKVGHTGIVLIERSSGQMLFYDFGRYISPRGYGRARSAETDPRLEIKMHAKFDQHSIQNLSEIMQHFSMMQEAMQGYGEVYFSVVPHLSFRRARVFANQWVYKGSYPYGALAKGNNNCSRFITRLLMKSSDRFHRWHWVNLPETIKASPLSNIVNASPDGYVYTFTQNSGIRRFKMNRWDSLVLLMKKLSDNFSHSRARLLPDDLKIGQMRKSYRHASIPQYAQYLGGVGEGAWYAFRLCSSERFFVERFSVKGALEYRALLDIPEGFDPQHLFEVTYDSHRLFTHVLQQNRKFRLKHLQVYSDLQFSAVGERYA